VALIAEAVYVYCAPLSPYTIASEAALFKELTNAILFQKKSSERTSSQRSQP